VTLSLIAKYAKIKSEFRSETWHFMSGCFANKLNITAPPPRNGSK